MRDIKVLLLFANSTVRQQKANPERLQKLLNDAAIELDSPIKVYVSFARSLSFFASNERVVIRDHRNHHDLDEYDFVYFRKAGAAMQQMLSCALYLRERSIPFYDREVVKGTSRNKLSQMFMLQQRQLPIPATLFCRNNRRLLRLLRTKYAEYFSFPLIAKATGGTRGEANYLVKSPDEIQSLLRSETRHFIIQEFIPNDGDYRFFVAGGRVRGIVSRKAHDDTHLNNTSKGGRAELRDPASFDPLVRVQALQAALVFRRDCAGVDIIFHKQTGEHFFLEVNRAPQIEESSFEPEKARWLVDAIEQTTADFQPRALGTRAEERPFIGRFEAVYLMPPEQEADERPRKVIAKIDTGADTSSIHCDKLVVQDGVLYCEIQKWKYRFEKFFVKRVRSSNGVLQTRYLVELPVWIGGVEYVMKITLNNRSEMPHSMLIGRRFLYKNRFMVDVGRRFVASGKRKKGKGV